LFCFTAGLKGSRIFCRWRRLCFPKGEAELGAGGVCSLGPRGTGDGERCGDGCRRWHPSQGAAGKEPASWPAQGAPEVPGRRKSICLRARGCLWATACCLCVCWSGASLCPCRHFALSCRQLWKGRGWVRVCGV